MAEVNAAREFLITVSGIEGYWARKSGAQTRSETSKEWDGGSLRPTVLTGPASTEDLTVNRPYRRARDADLLKRLKRVVGRSSHTITVTPTDSDLVPAGAPEVFVGVLAGVSGPDPDASASDGARIELVFAIEDAS